MTKKPGFFSPFSKSESQYVSELKREIERLKVALVVRDVKNDRLRVEGMEAAAAIKVVCKTQTLEGGYEHGFEMGVKAKDAAILAAAKEQTDG